MRSHICLGQTFKIKVHAPQNTTLALFAVAAAAVAGEVSQSEYQTMRKDNMAQIIAEINEDENGSPSDFGIYEAGLVAAAVSVLDNSITKQEFKQIYLRAKRRLDEATVKGYMSYEQMLAVQAKVQLALEQTLGVNSVNEFVRIDPDVPVDAKSERKVGSNNGSS